MAAAAVSSFGQDAARMDKLEAENKDLKARLEAIEAVAKKEGILPSAPGAKAVSAMSGVTRSTTVGGYNAPTR